MKALAGWKCSDEKFKYDIMCFFYVQFVAAVFSCSFFFFLCRVVEFATKEDMKNALKKLDDSELNGRRIRLKVVRPISHFLFSYLLYS